MTAANETAACKKAARNITNVGLWVPEPYIICII
jgi:hypothetical protein